MALQNPRRNDIFTFNFWKKNIEAAMEGHELIDNHGRTINYLRLSVTDRCNLRCHYCMPVNGVNFVNRKELLTYEEMLRLCAMLAKNGIEKIRITGGEPFVRADIIHFLEKLTAIEGIKKVSITTNGILVKEHINDLKRIGIKDINLSLDTLDKERFKNITNRDEFEKVRETLFSLINNDFRVKLNTVVMGGINDEDILPLARLSINLPVDVRFIEEMPFNGQVKKGGELQWNASKIIGEIKTVFPGIEDYYTPKHSTSQNYKIPGSRGTIGIIAAYTRTFCGTCNRIRINATGKMRTCLYGHEVLDVRHLLRSELTDDAVVQEIKNAIQKRAADGFEAEKWNTSKSHLNESMTKIGG